MIAKILGVEIQAKSEESGLIAKILNVEIQAESEDSGLIAKILTIENMTIFFPKFIQFL